MRRASPFLLAVFVLLGCAGNTGSSEPAAERFREDLVCTERPPGGEEACRAQGCRWGPMLICHGTEPTPEQREEERRVYEAGTVTCDCICPDDEKWCSLRQ